MNSRFDDALAALLAGPELLPGQEFIRAGATVGEVYRLAVWLREALDEAGVADDLVCLASENKALVAAALLAALGGGPTLLLPYSLSAKALEGMRQATGFTTVIADHAGELPSGLRLIQPPTAGDLPPLPGVPVFRPAAASRIVLRIFTGGTTGEPQIWSKTAENIMGEGMFLAQRFGVTAQDRIVATVPPFHIYGLLYSVVLPLVAGAAVIGPVPSFPGEIEQTIREHDATLFISVPAHYRAIRERRVGGDALRLAFSSAGMLDAEDNLAFVRQNGVGVVEVYGSTETGGIATRNRSRGESAFFPYSVVAWQVREERLAVRSPFLSPELQLAEDRFFLFGDRVEATHSGGFHLRGRADGVTKVGGKRVDLEEIRTLIRRLPGVDDCVVLALPESGGREHRIGVLLQGKESVVELVKKSLAGVLEPYALPRVVKAVRQLPVKPNGKYDRGAILAALQ
ncbi:MAG: hypothetical protein BWK76_14405 [Desulfobulbaceae bacterium A2]|nr:MAG: hypothetical protein BWK76_14405 [Desulfobulbaceae bacterium A2]